MEEYYYTEFNRVLIVKSSEGYLYSIDVYKRIRNEPGECEWVLSVDEASICYAPLGRDCTAVILKTGNGLEVVNLRRRADKKLDAMDVLRECAELAREKGLL